MPSHPDHATEGATAPAEAASPTSTPWFVYMLHCADNSLYTGITTDLQRRIEEHNAGPKGARYTRSRRPVCLVYSETLPSRADALRRELEIKRLDRSGKEKLVTSR